MSNKWGPSRWNSELNDAFLENWEYKYDIKNRSVAINRMDRLFILLEKLFGKFYNE